MKKSLLMIMLLGVTGCASFGMPVNEATCDTPLDAQIEGKVAKYAMMSANAYNNENKIQFPLERLGWSKVEYPNDDVGLAYNIYLKGNEVVFAIRGTDNWKDWLDGNGSNKQYQRMLGKVADFERENPGKVIVAFTGHSLGIVAPDFQTIN